MDVKVTFKVIVYQNICTGLICKCFDMCHNQEEIRCKQDEGVEMDVWCDIERQNQGLNSDTDQSE